MQNNTKYCLWIHTSNGHGNDTYYFKIVIYLWVTGETGEGEKNELGNR